VHVPQGVSPSATAIPTSCVRGSGPVPVAKAFVRNSTAYRQGGGFLTAASLPTIFRGFGRILATARAPGSRSRPREQAGGARVGRQTLRLKEREAI
jgi:hypothetical protein